ncbi:type I polyketide synthase, partial [Streptomyces sp. TP-A0356]|uniref:type I polyketide synthase n=1 Tax=Streptomyces sp. TP-A0356 TaxID=1359208 RepID=UPI001F1EAB28
MCAVSAFGVSGTNAHVILEQSPAPDQDRTTSPAVLPAVAWTLSARTDDALRAQARRLGDFLTAHSDIDPVDVGWSLATTRTTFEHRAVVLGADRAELLHGLAEVAARRNAARVIIGHGSEEGRLAFLFSGQGAQRLGMGRGLYEAFPVFAEAFDAVVAEVGEELRGVVFGEDAGLLNETRWAQPALFAVEVALFRLLESFGVRPDYLVGHSVGELAAAHVAGVLSLADACRLVVARGRLMQELPSGGAMVAVEAAEEEVLLLLAGREGEVSVAAVNGPRAVVVSGVEAAVTEVAERLSALGRRTSRLRVSHAFHSPLMEPMLEEFRRVAESIDYGSAAIPVVSNVSGRLADGGELGSAEYWVRHVREAVRFADGVQWLAGHGVTRFVEVGPDGTLTALAQACVPEERDALFVPALRKDRDEPDALLQALAGVFVHGGPVDWPTLFQGTDPHPVELPTYAFQRQRYWLDPSATGPQSSTGPEFVSAVVDSEFWKAVERDDLGTLADDLGVEPDVLGAALPALSQWYRKRVEHQVVNSWRYEDFWRPLARDEETRMPEMETGGPAPWLAVVPQDASDGVRATVQAVLDGLGKQGLLLHPLPVGDLDRVGLAGELRSAWDEVGRIQGVLSLLPLGDREDAVASATATLLQALSDSEVPARLWTLTQGAVRVGQSDHLRAPAQAAAWGVGRVAALEHPELWGGLVDLPADLDDRVLAKLVVAVTRLAEGEDQVAIRRNGLFGRRIRPVRRVREAESEWRPCGTVLITGGTGALGARVAHWAVERGARDLVLVSRRGQEAPGALELRDALSAKGARVAVEAVDVSDREALHSLLTRYRIESVFHTAGVLEDGVLHTTDPDRIERVMRAKADAARTLDELTRDQDLSAFVLFSSVAGAIGSAGQGAYAAANAVLDALAVQRRAEGLPATSIAWGPWAGGGMADEAAGKRRRGRGAVAALDPDLALIALGAAVDSGRAAHLIADIDWSRFGPAFTATRPSALIADLVAAPERNGGLTAERAASDTDDLAARVTALPHEAALKVVLDTVRARAASVLGHAGVEQVPAGRAFRDLGVDSLIAVELRNVLAVECGVALPATVVFDHPTPLALAEFVVGELGGVVAERSSGALVPVVAEDPIAIVGMACRFPGGVDSPEGLWRLLVEGGEGIGDFPDDRGWEGLGSLYGLNGEESGSLPYARRGAFLDGVSAFDAGFFGVSPREAVAMDPQQRLLLEVSWEAVERAGIDPGSLRGGAVGVFTGTNGQDYPALLAASGGDFGGYLGTGNAASVVSGRVSYVLGLEGPAVTVDTACSSSLVALHLAGQALRSGECDLALAGGVTVMSTPGAFVEFSRQGGLAGDGRCKAFAEGADGTGWGEGVGVLVVERLSDARRRGHRVLAVVRGSAVNQDGASNGLTAPNGPSQQRVIRAALASGGLSAADVDVVEAHGTGTVLGDPIEAQALLATYGQGRAVDRPLWLGSVKSNIGHTQAAAGVAGVIKMVLALERGVLPATLHVDMPSSHVDWDTGAVRLLTERRAWPETGERPRRAGVSSFGLSGTNAHLILEAPAQHTERTEQKTTAGTTPPIIPWVLSGKGVDALRAQAVRLLDHVNARPDLGFAEVARALTTTRSTFENRAVVRGADRAELLAGLSALAEGGSLPNVTQGLATEGRLAFLFSGQGAQRLGMGRGLYEAFPVFAEAFDAVVAEVGAELRGVVFGEDAGLLNETRWAQPALFAVEVALFRLLESFGVRPDYLVGHSVGELAAAHVAGVLSLPDACRLVVARGRLMQELPSGGVMVAVEASEEEVLLLLAGREGEVSVAAVNGPRAVVVSGVEAAVTEVVEQLSALGRRTSRLRVSHAFHSPLMEPMLEEFRRVAESIDYGSARMAVVSNVTGEVADGGELGSAEYWVRHVREAVRFADGVRWLAGHGVTRFVEVGPDGTLTALAQACVPEERDALFVPALRKERDEPDALLQALAGVFVHGGPVDWPTLLEGVQPAELPTYAFQRSWYWPEPGNPVPAVAATDPVEARFWEALERGDAQDLAGVLGVDRAILDDVVPALSEWRRNQIERSAVDGWRYRVTWERVPVGSAPTTLQGRWLLLHDGEDDIALDGIEEFLPGVEHVLCAPGAGRDQLAELLGAVGAGETVTGILCCLNGLPSVLALTQALGDAGVHAPLWLVTSGAVAVGDASEGAVDPLRAAMWGLGRVAALEHPDRWGGLLDVPGRPDRRVLA